ncbi:MAG: hypothetical protein IPP71_00015 [Bacteroidetes bacterium]|nr:hypothetical protein [Bacteroidota bacterium]
MYTDVHDFDIVHGDFPKSGLAKGSNGILYGVTTTGGSNQAGVLYSWNTISGTYTMLHEFGNGITYPQGAPVIHSNGKIYGMAYGGMYGMGIIYSYDINTATMSCVYSFTGSGGSAPVGSLIEAADGKLYGLTPSGGSAGYGVLLALILLAICFRNYLTLIYMMECLQWEALCRQPMECFMAWLTQVDFLTVVPYLNLILIIRFILKFRILFLFRSEANRRSFEMANVLYGATKNGGVYSYGTIFSYSLITNSLSIVAISTAPPEPILLEG